MNNEEIAAIVEQFQLDGEFIYGENYGCGHINDTYAVYFRRESEPPIRYILQRINTAIFEPVGLMHNISLVTDFLRKQIVKEGGDPDRETLRILPTKDDASFYKDAEGNCWRMYKFIENTVTYQSAATAVVSRNAGKAFGHFQKQLSGFDASQLVEIIPDFHNTRKRFETFKKTVEEDAVGRVASAKDAIDFVLAREKYCDTVIRELGSDTIPLRVTHNDTKLNNILMDPETGGSVCIVDLDTIMPGSVLYDFGDSNRFGSNTAVEDETDLSKVTFSLEMFGAYTEGFLEAAGDALTEREIELLPFSCIQMTYECGMRFLTDYLQGDTYFKVCHDTHNLERARNQFKLIEDMESKLDKMSAIVQKAKK